MMDWRTGAFLRHLRQLSAEQGAEHVADHELVERYAVRRDEAAFAVLVRRHGPLVWRVCLDVTRHEEDAEDAFQAAFLVLARRVACFRKEASLASWLHGVAYRVALRARAQAARRPLPEGEVEINFRADPLAEVSRREQLAILHAELNRLAAKYRAPLVLCYLEGKTQDEAARQLTWSKRTLERRLGQARGLLRRRLRGRGFPLPAGLGAGYLAPAAALPAGLVPATVRAAGAFVTRSAAVGGASAKATALAEGVLRATAIAQLKTMAVLVAVCGVLVAGARVLAHQAWIGRNPDVAPAERAAALRAAIPPPPAPRKKDRIDAYGDRLPSDVQARLGTIRLSVGNLIFAVAFSPDGKTLASGSGRGVRIWEAATGEILFNLEAAPGDCVLPLAFAPDGKTLAAGGLGHTIRVWDLRTGTVWRDLQGHEGKVFGLVFSPDGKTLASGTGPPPSMQGEGAVYLWEVATGQARWQTTLRNGGATSLTFAADGRVLALGGGDHRIYRLDLAARRELPPLTGHLGEILCLAYSPDGVLLASGSMDTTALIWKQTPLPRLATLRGAALTPQEFEALWNDLAGADAGQAYRAIWDLAGAAGQAVPLLAARLRPAAVEEAPGLRPLRAVEALERIATPEAYRLLQALAAGATEKCVTNEARSALRRLDKR
jgi:RNA polymerase sigma factor (sigma-70 family)